MALINCPECNKEISDKAAACPSCGCPIANTQVINQAPAAAEPDEEEEELDLRCPICLSKNIHVNQKGFQIGKAFVGAILTGGIGLLAGGIGSRKLDITCHSCGKRSKYALEMSKSQKKELDKLCIEKLNEHHNLQKAYKELVKKVPKLDLEAYISGYVAKMAEKHNIETKRTKGEIFFEYSLVIVLLAILFGVMACVGSCIS